MNLDSYSGHEIDDKNVEDKEEEKIVGNV